MSLLAGKFMHQRFRFADAFRKYSFSWVSKVFVTLIFCKAAHEIRLAYFDKKDLLPAGDVFSTEKLNQLKMHYVHKDNKISSTETKEGSPDTKPKLWIVFIGDRGQTTEMHYNIMNQCLQTIQPDNYALHVLCYDRPGYGYSPSTEAPRHANNMSLELKALVDSQVQTNDKIVLVGSGLGSLVARLYRDRFPEQINGMLLIDPIHEKFHVGNEEWRKTDFTYRRGWEQNLLWNQFGLLEICLKFPNYPFTKFHLNTLNTTQKDTKYDILSEEQLRSRIHFHVRKDQFWKTLHNESNSIPVSAKQVLEARKYQIEHGGVNRAPLTIIKTLDYASVGKEEFKKLDDNPEIYKDLLSISSGRTQYIEAKDLNHNNVLQSSLLRKAIEDIIKQP